MTIESNDQRLFPPVLTKSHCHTTRPIFVLAEFETLEGRLLDFGLNETGTDTSVSHMLSIVEELIFAKVLIAEGPDGEFEFTTKLMLQVNGDLKASVTTGEWFVRGTDSKLSRTIMDLGRVSMNRKAHKDSKSAR